MTYEVSRSAARGESSAAVAGRFDRLLREFEARLAVLDDKPEETPESALRALWHLAAGTRVSAQAALERALAPLGDDQARQLQADIERRLSGIPLAHLTGRQRFMGLELLASPEALIPRQETELLGGAAVDLLRQAAADGQRPVALDVCTGCGNIAMAMAAAVPQALVLAADISDDAVELARRNAAALGFEPRVIVRQGDLLAPFEGSEFEGQVDVLTCNPPYISSGKLASMPTEIIDHEPQAAFDGGPFGVRILTRFIQEAPRMLRRAGWLATEVGLGQGASVVRRLQATRQFTDIRSLTDRHGKIRAVVARYLPKPDASS